MPDREPLFPDNAAAAESFWRDYLTDPFAVRGPHQAESRWTVRTYQPGALRVRYVVDGEKHPLEMTAFGRGLFIADVPSPSHYRLRIQWPGVEQETEDPYSFGFILGDLDLLLFAQGSHWRLAHRFGAVPESIDGIEGVSFAVWAPNARRVSVVGDFNTWNGTRHAMRRRPEAGVWELFIPRLRPGERYKYEIEAPDGTILPQKSDPIARATEHPPATASVVASKPDFAWHDSEWMAARAKRQMPSAPISIYEVHAGSWKRPFATPTGRLNWRGLTRMLIPYVQQLGCTHIELMPIMEHPFGGSWGYQPLSQFAPSARYGSPSDFAAFVDACHGAGIGVILDWVPAHFPDNVFGLIRFDGTALYEHADPREGFHPDWNTYVYNLGRTEVQGFLIASALWWLEQFHVDGLRVDAVASMLYRDYSRSVGQWIPNRFGGRENLEAIAFLRRLNNVIAERVPGAITIAEESTAWPGVSAPQSTGGLGFSYKWNMGWMHDTLNYIRLDPIYRRWHHHGMTFSLVYAFAEKFVLPLSHDEIVYGKGSLYERIPGPAAQKLATLRAYYTFMWTHPGKKLLFMGDEFAMTGEWNHDAQLAWHQLTDLSHGGVRKLLVDLNRLYRDEPALHLGDSDSTGFEWLIVDEAESSIFAYVRNAEGAAPIAAIINMTPVVRSGYRVGLPWPGRWSEILNSDSELYGGSNLGNGGGVYTEPVPMHGRMQSATLTVPPLGAVLLRHSP
ncbi:MAG: 1,4-alpha-glucan branching protein GlgB [Alphaproteobacteria bacterium]|nr:1,4-alpha-glucan branching protein GlgB [Alphaproteobacteria bacterium]